MISTILSNNELVEIVTIILFALLGSCAKDYVCLLNKELTKINLLRIFFATITGSIISYFAYPIVIYNLDFRGVIFSSFLLGLTGFELLQKLSSLNGIFNLIRFILYTNIKKIDDEIGPNRVRVKEDKNPLNITINNNSNIVNKENNIKNIDNHKTIKK